MPGKIPDLIYWPADARFRKFAGRLVSVWQSGASGVTLTLQRFQWNSLRAGQPEAEDGPLFSICERGQGSDPQSISGACGRALRPPPSLG